MKKFLLSFVCLVFALISFSQQTCESVVDSLFEKYELATYKVIIPEYSNFLEDRFEQHFSKTEQYYINEIPVSHDTFLRHFTLGKTDGRHIWIKETNNQPTIYVLQPARYYEDVLEPDSTGVYPFGNISPLYPGGGEQLLIDIKKNYPYNNQLPITCNFVVDTTGQIENIIVRKDVENCDDCSTYAIQALKNIKKKFTPAYYNCKKVAVRYVATF